jgi:hypothetical protein
MDVLRPERLELRVFTHKTLQLVETTVNKYIIPLYISILTRDTILNSVRINSSQVCDFFIRIFQRQLTDFCNKLTLLLGD